MEKVWRHATNFWPNSGVQHFGRRMKPWKSMQTTDRHRPRAKHTRASITETWTHSITGRYMYAGKTERKESKRPETN